MALNPQQKMKLSRVLREFAAIQGAIDGRSAIDIIQTELFLAFFENDTQRTTRAQNWIAVVKAKRQADRAAADATNTAYKSTLDTDITDLDTINSSL